MGNVKLLSKDPVFVDYYSANDTNTNSKDNMDEGDISQKISTHPD